MIRIKTINLIFIVLVAVSAAFYWNFSSTNEPARDEVLLPNVSVQGSQPEAAKKQRVTQEIGHKRKQPQSSLHKAAPANIAPEAMGLDRDEYEQAKSIYFCDLARTARENCELVPRDQQGHEHCLKLNGYYTHSRYCGYHP